MNQYSRWALSEGIQRGEPIALMMGNRPEYFVIWLGLIQVGAIVALFGSDLRRARDRSRFEGGWRSPHHRFGGMR